MAKSWKSVTRCDQIDKLEVSLYYYGKYSIGNIYRKSLPKAIFLRLPNCCVSYPSQAYSLWWEESAECTEMHEHETSCELCVPIQSNYIYNIYTFLNRSYSGECLESLAENEAQI